MRESPFQKKRANDARSSSVKGDTGIPRISFCAPFFATDDALT
jgi:hypothetical protein